MKAHDELFSYAYKAILQSIENGFQATPYSIHEVVTAFASEVMPLLWPGLVFDADVIDSVSKEIETLIDITIDPDTAVKKDYKPWLADRRREINPYYWNRYKQLLITKGLPPSVIAEMGAGTDGVLDLLRDPLDGTDWDRRGLVMGNVQSGKTAHYTGLVCKAADAGFKVIIVIAGIHNNLRNQTQGRIDEGFIGEHRVRERTSVRRELIGVGKIDDERRPVGFTSSNQDFTKSTADAMKVPFDALKEPAVFVIKKNATTLKNLVAWLKPVRGTKIPHPLLLIDDEADNASINVAYSKDTISTINGHIRELLDLFSKSAYVGYTATPFANIFIDPESETEMLNEDLFPRSFIVSMDAPSNYMGPSKVFLDEPDAFLRWIEDAKDILPTNHKKGHGFRDLPETMVDAIRGHVIARAIRVNRGDASEHSSMLINASRFVDVQSTLRNRVGAILERIHDATRLNHALPNDRALQDPEIAHFQRVYDKEYAESGVEWHDVLAQLWDASAPIKVAVINNASPDRLDYGDHPEGLHVIAIGGLALSRGLTLEGLMTTYFLRNSQMYDTLLQMGRWFGYRPRYEDLCRIHMPEEVAGWYAHIAESVNELREELREMAADGRSPEDFGLKVRSHPATLIVTARNKMGAAESATISIGLAERNAQTRSLSKSSREANLATARRLLDRLEADGKPLSAATESLGGLVISDAPLAHVRRFLQEIQNDPLSMLTDPSSVLQYIDGRPHELALWDVFVPHVKEKESATTSNEFGIQLHLRSRTVDTDDVRVEFRNANFVSPTDEQAGLSSEQVLAAEANFRDNHSAKDGKYNYPALYYRRERTRPQLGLHLLRLDADANKAKMPQPWLAWNISFPPTKEPNETTKYVVNPVWMADKFIGLGDEDDD